MVYCHILNALQAEDAADKQRDNLEEAEPTSTEVVTQILNNIIDNIPGKCIIYSNKPSLLSLTLT